MKVVHLYSYLVMVAPMIIELEVLTVRLAAELTAPVSMVRLAHLAIRQLLSLVASSRRSKE